jgi:transposase
VFTGAGRRRTWSDEDTARIVATMAVSRESVSAVARRHGLSPQQLFGWRRKLQASQTALSPVEELQFVPAILDEARLLGSAFDNAKCHEQDRPDVAAAHTELKAEQSSLRTRPTRTVLFERDISRSM